MDLTVVNVLLSVSFLTTAVLSTLMAIRSGLLSSKFLSAAAFGAVVWIASMIIFKNTLSIFWAIFSAKMLYVAGVVIVTNFFYFTYFFLREKLTDGKFKMFVLGLPSLLFIVLIIFSNYVIKDVEFFNGGDMIVKFDFLYYLYAAYMIVWSVAGYYYLIKKTASAVDKTQKRQLVYVGLGTMSAVTFGLVFDIILPMFGNFDFYWLGPVLVTFFVVFASYAIAKHHLFDVKVITTELFSAILLIILVVRFALSESAGLFLLNGIIALSFIAFGALLIRSVWKEVHTREKVQDLAAELEKANAHLRELDQSKSEFLSIAAHQLRTPITGVKGYVSMLLEGDYGELTPPQRLELERIYRASDRLTRLIDVFLNVSRIETGHLELKKTPSPFAQIVDDVVSDLTNAYKKKGLKLAVAKPSAPLPPILIDRDKIQDVVLNLVDNAIKYTDTGSIDIRFDRSPSLLSFQIKDTGAGISPEGLDKLFQKFSRADVASHIQTGGSGLGLFVAKKIVEAHGGRIWAESEGEGEGQGATFTFTLPIVSEGDATK